MDCPNCKSTNTRASVSIDHDSRGHQETTTGTCNECYAKFKCVVPFSVDEISREHKCPNCHTPIAVEKGRIVLTEDPT